ncbi:VanW family protein [Adlercreutzia sp. ZJ176]|uniref:VanW family protein n=2 Tax=unclassified Adlercreutzia TaxID=2636013 RepID=UPI0013EA8142|nr:VanW family protein [Adlercreutzia sp. ZJ176]
MPQQRPEAKARRARPSAQNGRERSAQPGRDKRAAAERPTRRRRETAPQRPEGERAPRAQAARKPRPARAAQPTRGVQGSRGQGTRGRRKDRTRRDAPATGLPVQPITSPQVVGEQSLPERVLGLLAAVLLGLIKVIGRGISLLFSLVRRVAARSRVAAVVLVVACVLLVGGLVDAGLTAGKVYRGVTIGTVDVSGMTEAEAALAVSDAYAGRLAANHVIIFANDEVANSVDVEQQIVQDQARAEQISFEEAQKSKSLWVRSAQSLNATLPVEGLVDEALEVGRGGLGPIDRIRALLGGWNVAVRVDIGADELESLASDIDSAIGDPRQDFDIAFEEGVASVVEGHDGSMVNRQTLADELNAALLSDEDGAHSFVARVEYAPLRIDEAGAQKTCDAVNALIADGAAFSTSATSFSVERAELARWVGTRVEGQEGAYELVPYVDHALATPSLVELLNESTSGSGVAVDFDVAGDEVTVTPRGEVTAPMLDAALNALDANLFGPYRERGTTQVASGEAVPIETKVVSGALSFDEAAGYGLVTEISSFTTLFTNTESTSNRNHNIRLVSDLLNNSVTQSGGGTWSFNETAGNCNEEAGFLPAGAISGGEYIDEAGGGICQVATTVFNAVYEGGFPVDKRMNHTLYMASYPAGRDAAVSYPDLDFVWRNDTDSDVLLRTSYTDSSVTVTLYGVDLGYSVSTETGEWVEGEEYDTREEVDDTLAPGTRYVKTVGTDGLEIMVQRTVKAKDGTLVRQDSFYSVYAPIDEVIVKGPDAPEG